MPIRVNYLPLMVNTDSLKHGEMEVIMDWLNWFGPSYFGYISNKTKSSVENIWGKSAYNSPLYHLPTFMLNSQVIFKHVVSIQLIILRGLEWANRLSAPKKAWKSLSTTSCAGVSQQNVWFLERRSAEELKYLRISF